MTPCSPLCKKPCVPSTSPRPTTSSSRAWRPTTVHPFFSNDVVPEGLYIPLNSSEFFWGHPLKVDLYVKVLRLLQTFLLQRNALQETGARSGEEATLLRSEALNPGIFRCVYQSVNFSADNITRIVEPILPIVLRMNDNPALSKYFNCAINLDALNSLYADVITGKDVPHHYLQRLKIVVTLFSEQERISVCERVIETIGKLLDHLSGTTETISQTVLLYVEQLLGVLCRLKLQSRHFETLFPYAGRLMQLLDVRCPLFANNRDLVENSWRVHCRSSLSRTPATRMLASSSSIFSARRHRWPSKRGAIRCPS